jgi:hypothetical protein
MPPYSVTSRGREKRKEANVNGSYHQAERRRQEKAVAVDCGPRLDKPLRKNQKCYEKGCFFITIGRPNN